MDRLRLRLRSYVVAILLLGAFAASVHAQSIVREWRRVFDSGGRDGAGQIAVTPAGDLYVMGSATRQDTTRLLLLYYTEDGALRWSRELPREEWLRGPFLTVDSTGRAVIAGYDLEPPPCDGGFVTRFDTDGGTLWTQCIGTSNWTVGVETNGADRIHVASANDFGQGLWLPSLAILSLDGDVLCNEYALSWRFGVSDALVTQDGSTLFIGTGGEEFDGPIRMARFGDACENTWLGAVGIGGWAKGVTVVEGAWCDAVFIGNIEVGGDMDLWLGCYTGREILDARCFDTFDMAGGNDTVVSVAADTELGVLTGTTEGMSIDVLIGTFACSYDWCTDSWWTYDGSAGGDDRGIDIDLLPSGEILVLARVAGSVDNDQALLLYSRDGQLLDLDLDSFNDNPAGLAITSDGAIYTASSNPEGAPHAAGDIIVNKYSVSAVGIGSAEPPAVLRVNPPEPNPSSGTVFISYELPTDTELLVRVYDASGRLVRTLVSGSQTSGAHQLLWDGMTDAGKPAPSGVYFLRFDLGNRVERRQIVLAR